MSFLTCICQLFLFVVEKKKKLIAKNILQLHLFLSTMVFSWNVIGNIVAKGGSSTSVMLQCVNMSVIRSKIQQ